MTIIIIESYSPDDVVPDGSVESDSEDDPGMSDEESVHAQVEINLNSIPQMLREDPTLSDRGVREENINRRLIEQEMGEAEANAANLDVVAYMEAHTLEFENASTWKGIAAENL